MGIFSWIFGRKTNINTTKIISNVEDVVTKIPFIVFEPSRVTEDIKISLSKNIRSIKEIDDVYFNVIYEAALLSISKGRDLSVIFNAIIGLNLPAMTKQRASEIARNLNNRATILMDRNRQESIGITHAAWVYSGAPCHKNPRKPSPGDRKRDTAHRAADGKRYEIKKGLLLNGRFTTPGWEEGCRCAARVIVPGIED